MVRIDKISITNALRSKIVDQIRSDLTIGRKQYKKEEYSPEKIIEFINDNKASIDALINYLIQIYEESDELYILIKPQQEHILEFFYDYFKIPLSDDELIDAI
jgi:DNA polymerase II small subunit/DNA polymerase delta subunit B